MGCGECFFISQLDTWFVNFDLRHIRFNLIHKENDMNILNVNINHMVDVTGLIIPFSIFLLFDH